MQLRVGLIAFIIAALFSLTVQQTAPVQTDEVLSSPMHGVVRFGTFNIQYGRGIDGRVDLQRIAETITSHHLDVVFLNEVDKRWQRSGWQDQTKMLKQLTQMPHTTFAPALQLAFGASAYGNAILSQWPWADYDIVSLPRHGLNEPRNMVIVRFPLADGSKLLTLVGTHLSTHTAERRSQLQFIEESLSMRDDPIMIFGDFNAGPAHEDIRRLIKAGWIDIWSEYGDGDGYTFPSNAPAHRIDYILASPQAARGIRRIEVIQTEVSDHFPVIIEYDLNALLAHVN